MSLIYKFFKKPLTARDFLSEAKREEKMVKISLETSVHNYHNAAGECNEHRATIMLDILGMPVWCKRYLKFEDLYPKNVHAQTKESKRVDRFYEKLDKEKQTLCDLAEKMGVKVFGSEEG